MCLTNLHHFFLCFFSATAGLEILVCMTTALLSCKVAQLAKQEVHKKNEGTFSVTVLSAKDIVIHTTKKTASYDKLSEVQTNSSMSTAEAASPTTAEKSEDEEASEAMIPACNV